jgi:uncharacterized membrane protein YbhN (UPF0104 family)
VTAARRLLGRLLASVRRARLRIGRVLRLRTARLGLSILALAAAGWLIWREVKDVEPWAIFAAIRATPPLAIAASIVLALASYACLATIEWYALRFIGHRQPRLKTALRSFAANALSVAMGFGLASGTAVRLRLYAFAGLSASEVTGLVVLMSGATFLSGLLTGALAVLLDPLPLAAALSWPSWAVRMAATVLVTPAALWFLVRRPSPHEASAAPTQMASRAIALAGGLGDWLFSGAALFVLYSHDLSAFPAFLRVFCLGSLLGAIVGTPGGLGVLEATVLGLQAHGRVQETAAALLLYRVIYLLGPLALTAIGMAVRQGLAWRANWAGPDR